MIFHKPGRTNAVADALSRPVEFSAVAIAGPDPTLANMIKLLYADDEFCSTLLEQLRARERSAADRYALQDGLIILREGNRVVLPRDDRLLLDVLVHYHDNAVVAHAGAVRSFLALRQHFLWRGMRSTVDEYIRTCETCARNKSGDQRRGLLQPLPIPTASWRDISMDFVTGLPLSKGFDTIYVTVCRLSKRARHLLRRKDASADDVAQLCFNSIIVIQCTPRSIVSDRDPKFLSDLWTAMAKIMQIELHMAVSHCTQADGQSERQIQTLEDALRCSVSHYGDDWAD
ncbi:unnamed protein product [Phytophthora fragariaefolia]|uniref:Unnamed protein product n=1 Tax=Phytophthora fragariaefolia TaxID=1490495 RepID=A0A9W6XMK7_9STRA|nr:unnamed protein product [Phytophthora fragariaefolia]